MDRQCLLQVLAQISLLGKISQQWDRSEISTQSFKDQVLVNSKRLLLLVDLPTINSKTDLRLAEVLAELQSQQDLR